MYNTFATHRTGFSIFYDGLMFPERTKSDTNGIVVRRRIPVTEKNQNLYHVPTIIQIPAAYR